MPLEPLALTAIQGPLARLAPLAPLVPLVSLVLTAIWGPPEQLGRRELLETLALQAPPVVLDLPG